MKLIRIEAPYFVAGLVYNEETKKARRWAPILSYMSNWSLDDIRAYCKKRDWKLEELDGR